jgi:hypothetical protein
LRGVDGQAKRNALLNGSQQEFTIQGHTYPAFHFAHPGIVMRPATDSNRWPALHKSHISTAKRAVTRLLAK